MRLSFDHFLASLGKNSFGRAAALLVGGAGLAHAITALALPLLSRLYAPEDFSALAVFNSIFSLLTVIACLRYDIAVSLPSSDNDSFNLMGLAVLTSAMFSVIISIPLVFWSTEIADLIGYPSIEPYLSWLPFAIFLSAIASAMQNWFIRAKGYSLIAASRVTQSAGAVVLQLGMALIKTGPAGLILGSACNTGAASLVLGYGMYRRGAHRINTVSWTRMRALARAYRQFPRYSTLEALCNMASIQIPILMIAAIIAGPEPGYLLLAISVLQAPMALFGVAIGQVYLSLAPAEYRSGNLAAFTVHTIAMLVRSGVGPLIAAGIAAPFLFELVFGDGWDRAGLLLAWMTPWFIMQLITSPISMALAVTGNQLRALALQIFNLVCRTGSVYLAWKAGAGAGAGAGLVAEAYALSGLLSYFVYYIVVMRTIGAPVVSLAAAFRTNISIITIWITATFVFVGLINIIFL
jgi:O-antigen/teichoic acid export membrane protein